MRSGVNGFSRLLVAGLLALSLAGAVAVGAASRQTDVGVRAIGMGGAFSAVASDATAIRWNPAAIAALQRQEIDAAYDCARQVGFPQINIDLIAGMVGETDENWQDCIRKIRERAPESITIYQMEIPYNTTIYRRMKDGGEEVAPVADWDTKRRWVDEAFRELAADGYTIGSAYTAKKDDAQFLYRDGLWHGADMLGIGVASFSHLSGVHFQNRHDLEPYLEGVESGELPIHRALEIDDDQKLIREFILQLKFGEVGAGYFQDKFGVDVRERFAAPLRKHADDGFLSVSGDRIILSRAGLLQVDRLLYDFFLDEHRGARYA